MIDEGETRYVACEEEYSQTGSFTACDDDGDCRSDHACADTLAVTGDRAAHAGKFCTAEAQCFVDNVVGPPDEQTFYAVCPETSGLTECDPAFWSESCGEDDSCAALSW